MRRLAELDITDLAYNGKSVGYINGKVTLVNGGLPGERVRVELIKSRRNYNEARLLQVLTRSAERIDPVCVHYAVCGGCTWQDLDYDSQLKHKRNQVIASLEHLGGFPAVDVDAIHPAPDRFFYRNKMEFSFHVTPPDSSGRGFVLGLHERNRFDRIFDVIECHLQSKQSNRLLGFLRQLTVDLRLPVYDLLTHEGFLRFAVIREGKQTGQTMLTMVTGAGEFPRRDKFIAALRDEFPELTTIVWMVNESVTNIARGEIREVLFGPGYIEEQIMGLRFRISPGAFFQTNSRQTESLYRAAIDLAAVTPADTLLDLYCGAGTIGLCAAAGAHAVVGIDLEAEAIASARLNASINGIPNAEFHSGLIRELVVSDALRGRVFDPVVVDPPRAGMHPDALKRIVEINPSRLIYISCNPATFARDAKALVAWGYTLEKVIPFDMFPHTMHIELVGRFVKSD